MGKLAVTIATVTTCREGAAEEGAEEVRVSGAQQRGIWAYRCVSYIIITIEEEVVSGPLEEQAATTAEVARMHTSAISRFKLANTVFRPTQDSAITEKTGIVEDGMF